MIAQQQHPRIERAGHDRRQKAVAGDQRETLATIVFDGGTRGRGALPAKDLDFPRPCRIEDRRHLA